MANNSVAVGCAVGIPVGVCFFIAGMLWMRSHRRFKEEDKRDETLQNEMFDENASVRFDNVSNMKEDGGVREYQREVDDDSVANQKLGTPKKQNSYYMPAYKRRAKDAFKTQLAGSIQSPMHSSNNIRTPLAPAGSSEFRSDTSLLDNMIPVMNDEKKLYSVDENELSTTNTRTEDNAFSHSAQIDLVNNLNKNDLGSYYPRTGPSQVRLLNLANDSSISFNSAASIPIEMQNQESQTNFHHTQQ